MTTREGIRRDLRKGALVIGVAALAVAVAAPVAAANVKTERSSVKSRAIQANGRSEEPSISSNGRYVVFNSKASNLVRNDSNGAKDDCFIRDHWNKKTRIVSVSSSGVRGNGQCWGPAVSGNGRFVAFESLSDNLVPGDTNGAVDIFVRDMKNKTTARVSVSSLGEQGNGGSTDPGISETGRFVVFESNASTLVDNDTNGNPDVYVHDRRTGLTTLVSVGISGQGNSHSGDPAISANGKFVVFKSTASNLVGNDTNGQMDVFIRDLKKGRTKRVSLRSNGAQARGGDSGNPAVSATGRFVAFDSFAKNLVRNDRNGVQDVFVHDRQTKKTTRVSVRTGGGQANNRSIDPVMSANGRYIAFASASSNLVRNDTNRKWDGFVHDRWKNKTKRVSVRTGGGQANGGHSSDFAISGNGRWVAFKSNARNLVARDTNRKQDIFRRGSLQ